ncbi:MAG: Fe(2+)-trafficking protein [Thermoanaerobaculia bacterium]
MSAEVACARCRRLAPAIVGRTYPGALGEEIRTKVCADCWAEWQRTEVMVINELKLDFMEPRSQEVLVQHLREFLALDAPSGAAG